MRKKFIFPENNEIKVGRRYKFMNHLSGMYTCANMMGSVYCFM